MKVESHILDGSATVERIGGERVARENAGSKARPVGREGIWKRSEMDQKYKNNLSMLSGSCRQRPVIVVATTVFTLVSVNIL